MNGIGRTFLCLSIILLVPGCKLAVMVSSQGKVESTSGTRDCYGPGYCEFEITDPAFSDTFTAVPHPGFEFVRWQNGYGFACADDENPVCALEMPNESVGAAVVALFSTASLRPIFSDPGGVDTDGDGTYNEFDTDDDNDGWLDYEDDCPLEAPDLNLRGCPTMPEEGGSVIVGDNSWLQPWLFSDLTWNDIDAVCPAETGVCSGMLGYLDVTGWTWATGDEVSAMLNEVLSTSTGMTLGAVPDYYAIHDWVHLSPSFFGYFWSQTYDVQRVGGWVRDEANALEGYSYRVSCSQEGINPNCFQLTVGAQDDGNPIPKEFPDFSVWLYQPNE